MFGLENNRVTASFAPAGTNLRTGFTLNPRHQMVRIISASVALQRLTSALRRQYWNPAATAKSAEMPKTMVESCTPSKVRNQSTSLGVVNVDVRAGSIWSCSNRLPRLTTSSGKNPIAR